MDKSKDDQKSDICVIFITHQAKHLLPFSLPPLLKSPLNPKVLVVNSSSEDGTVELAKEMGAETLVIPRSDFNHGKTRELARKYADCKIVVMMTPDAFAEDEGMLEKLVAPLKEGKAAVSYARQLPHKGADLFEAFSRNFNYPEKSHIRSLQDSDKWGVYTFFCSNSCAAYLNEALDKVGGFEDVLTGEDSVACAKLLRNGFSVAYVAEAQVRHSHNYSLVQEFKRYFDTGLARKNYGHLLKAESGDTARGKEYAKSLLKTTLKHNPMLVPYAIMQTAIRYGGYWVGQKSEKAPIWLKKVFSSQDFYWKG